MRIESSVTGMESERSYSAVSYSERNLRVAKLSGQGIGTETGFASYGGASSFLDTLLGKYEKGSESEAPEGESETGKTDDKKPSIMDIMSDMSAGSITPEESTQTIRSDTSAYVRKMSVLYIFSILFEEYRNRIDDLMADIRKGYEGSGCISSGSASYTDASQSSSIVKMDMSEKHYFRETEDTGFRSKGKALTADGREIEFNIDVRMSREFEEYSERRLSAPHYVDPLVINLGPGVTEVSDQEFYFDLNADGTEDRIKALESGSGFLALDINEDGKIGDGSELFGARTGNGFEELARFDSDKDGWIDEDDEIFDKLRIWVKEKDGSDKLLDLKEAGVGAINLMNASTEYSLKDAANRTNAVIRATGMFLYEDGRAGTMQQVDMVS